MLTRWAMLGCTPDVIFRATARAVTSLEGLCLPWRDPAPVAGNGLKPCLLPKYQAAGLTATVGLTIAAVL